MDRALRGFSLSLCSVVISRFQNRGRTSKLGRPDICVPPHPLQCHMTCVVAVVVGKKLLVFPAKLFHSITTSTRATTASMLAATLVLAEASMLAVAPAPLQLSLGNNKFPVGA